MYKSPHLLLCPVCHTPATMAIDIMRCWNTHEPEFWNHHLREEIATLLHVTPGRVSQMVKLLSGEKKQYTSYIRGQQKKESNND